MDLPKKKKFKSIRFLKMKITYTTDKSEQISELEQQNSAAVRKIVGEAAVLLKNDGVLPLPSAGKVSLYGNAARNTFKGGTGSGCVNSRFVVNIETGLENEGFTINNTKWLD